MSRENKKFSEPNAQVYEQLKKDYPILDKYEAALQKRKSLSGYWAERVDREISLMAKQIIANEELRIRINKNNPMLNKQLNQYAHSLDIFFDQER